MKKITLITFTFMNLMAGSQTYTGEFENFGLAPNSYYKDTNNAPFVEAKASFMYQWTKGNYPFWSGGFSYTNVLDSATSGYTNLYGIKALKGYGGSQTWVVGQDRGAIKLTGTNGMVSGFYMTNTTYAYKSMKNGDAFAKKFGGTSGNDPDYLKVVVRGFLNGAMKADSVVHYLADFRYSNNSQDFISSTWDFVDASALGTVDSIKFFMASSDIGQFGYNTPLFFAIDHFVTKFPDITGVTDIQKAELNIYPNPFSNMIFIEGLHQENSKILLTDISGKKIEMRIEGEAIHTENLSPGIYILSGTNEAGTFHQRLIKN